jgi:CHAD domain-containing protein
MSSRAYRLKADEGVPEGLRRIAAGRASKATERLAAADEESLAAAIHGARKDLKKLRALLRLIRTELGKGFFAAENRRYRDAGRLLSGSRDAEVKLETLIRLRERYDDLPEAGCRLWEKALEAERDEIAAGLGDDGRVDEAARTIEEGRDRIRERSLGGAGWKLVEPGLTETYRGGRRAMKRVLADPSPENVHAWRKRGKDLWYQLRIVDRAWPELIGETAEQAHAFTDCLGDHHDLALLDADLRSRPELGEHDAFEEAIAERQEELFDAAVELGLRLYAEKPKAFRRRIGSYWRAWRGA